MFNLNSSLLLKPIFVCRCWHITRLYPGSHINVCGIWMRHRLLQPESDSCDTRLSMTTKTIWSPSWLRGKNTMLSHPWRIPSPTLYKWVHYLSLATLISWVCLFFCRQLQWSQISYLIWFTRTRTSKTIYGIGAMRLRQYLIASLLPSWASRNHPSQPAAIRLGSAIDIQNQSKSISFEIICLYQLFEWQKRLRERRNKVSTIFVKVLRVLKIWRTRLRRRPLYVRVQPFERLGFVKEYRLVKNFLISFCLDQVCQF